MKLLQLCLLLSASIFVVAQTTAPLHHTVSNVVNGTAAPCRTRNHSSTTENPKQPSKACYRSEQFICCQEEMSTKLLEQRPSAKACAKFYPEFYPVIFGGIKTKYKEHPYMIALGWESPRPNELEYKCGGVLISRKFALTAAHCAYYKGRAPVAVLPGGVNLTDTTAKPVKICRMILHPNYKPEEKYNDIAIIELEQSIEQHQPACIWPDFDLIYNNMAAIGYGRTETGLVISEQLLMTTLYAISNVECEQYYGVDENIPNGIIDAQLCAGDPLKHRDTCQGDSGGPLIMYIKTSPPPSWFWRPYVVAITSFGQVCAGSFPGVYTRVSAYTDWIESIVWPTTA